ncbi:hypothetical protein [Haliangium ochraceum]|uniref:N-acetyltransferase domain-containing protein n=1 Tax=Haliangium ochraceum (strain DSM 14365 / JCM 11303 / SMP-2) TaxID=502025 RepID=D0LXV3_HALO1|nr:hypothetical protein [Haliangium ochraceum]ACY14308.1 hypothetical protein Hoch_1759 [Haliangium ochraceum DSM 14365]
MDPIESLETNSELSFRVADISHLDAILDEFYRGRLEPGPLFNATGVTQADVVPVATSWLEHMLPQRLTMLAFDGDRIVGMAMGEDFANPWSSAGVTLSPAMAPCVAFLDQITREYHAAQTPPPQHTVNLVVLKVRKEYSGAHVSKTIVVQGVPILRERGFRKLIGMLSGSKSQYLAGSRFGFKLEHELRYKDFEYQGRRPFAGITDTESMKVMALRLA